MRGATRHCPGEGEQTNCAGAGGRFHLAKAAEAAPAVMTPSSRADQPVNDESRGESPVATAGTAWPVLPNTEGASAPGTTSVDATEAATANAVQMVDPNEVNELDRAAAATVTVESSSIT